MSEDLSNTGATTASDSRISFASIGARLTGYATSRHLALAAFLLTIAISLAYSPFKQLERGDAAIYDYIAQSILRGDLPYRDVIDPKAPAAMYLSAASMAVGRFVGLSEIKAVRLLHLLLMGVLALLTFQVAEAFLRSRVAAGLAVLLLVLREDTLVMMFQGTQPKLSMMVFGMLTLLMVGKDKPMWAGVSSMLACLCWQPGLLFTGSAFLIFSRYLRSWRDGRVVKLAVGAALPLGVTVLYFYVRGGLGALVDWTLVFPYSVFAPHEQKSLGTALGHMWKITRQVYERDIVVLGLSLIGLLMYAVARLRAKFKEPAWWRGADLYRDALVFPPLVYFGFCLIDMQGGPDLIPFFPFIGIFAGWLVVEAGRWLSRIYRDEQRRAELRVWVPRVALVLMLLLVVSRAARNRFEGGSLQDQEINIKAAFAELGPEDKLYVHGPAEILLMLGRRNLNPYISFDSGADDFIGSKQSGGFSAVLGEMEAQAPKFVVMARLRNVTHREELRQWLDEHYEKQPVSSYEIYRRKP